MARLRCELLIECTAAHILEACAAWRQTPAPRLPLHLVCLLSHSPAWPEEAFWPDPARDLAAELAGQWQGLIPGVHRLELGDGAFHITLAVGAPLAQLRAQDIEADHITLAREPADMPSHALSWAKALARCSQRGTQLVASDLCLNMKSALEQVGFRSTGAPAHGLQQVFDPAWPHRRRRVGLAAQAAAPAQCLVIGAGLAGAACAASLARRGWQVTVLDRHGPAAGASGLPVGLMAPHVSPDDSALSRLSRAGVRATLREARRLLISGQDWSATGVLQRRMDGLRLPVDWPEAGRFWSCDAQECADLPAALRTAAIWHGQGAWVRPERLVRAWLGHPGVSEMTGHEVHRLHRDEQGCWHALAASGRLLARAPWVVLAAAHGCERLLAPLLAGQGPGLQAIRGQVSWGLHAPGEVLPPVPVNGHGSLVPDFPTDGGRAWLLGASFERDEVDERIRPGDHAVTLAKLEQLLPDTAASLRGRLQSDGVQAWAGVRCAWRDHLPLVGPLSDSLPGLWLCTAMGSRGLSYSALCAELIAAWLHGEPLPLEPRLALQLQASRLLKKR